MPLKHCWSQRGENEWHLTTSSTLAVLITFTFRLLGFNFLLHSFPIPIPIPNSMDENSDFPEWEFLQNSDDSLDFSPHLDSPLIKPNHFSLHHHHPDSTSNSETDPSEIDRNFDDSYVANQLFPDGEKQFLVKESSPSSLPSSSSTLSNPENNESGNDDDSDCDTKMMMVVDEIKTSEILLDDVTTTTAVVGGGGGGFDDSKDDDKNNDENNDDENEYKRRVVWWKIPFEVLKYWVIRVSPVPVWSLSVAATAAFLGLVILGRRLYKMKRKTQTLKLNLALDDKKVSQLMGRVARLNEAFSVVRRVPIGRPSLPASSVTLRPVISMR
ncbi:hypothetical protein Lal_00027193 [Lupinus albus]|uniref:DUF6821 domain-containing protein n=1 Tax=Lupinus albus TaxID=3870 RepID=A0A6A4P0S0_LUPAL|nr:hypothetical protein Lalb_Chr15g0080071 [Lupinus albus]KAF1894345.1 hypothetical protein Lal_00027193 [Lupinus albus]